MALFGCLLHQLHDQLMGLSHHGCPVHADQLIPGAQPAVLVGRPVFHNVANVDLKQRIGEERRGEGFFFEHVGLEPGMSLPVALQEGGNRENTSSRQISVVRSQPLCGCQETST